LSAPLDRLTTRDAESIRNDRRRCSPSHPVQSGLSKPLLSVQTVDERQISEELSKSPPALRILSNLLLGSPARSEVRAYGGRGRKHLRRRPADREPVIRLYQDIISAIATIVDGGDSGSPVSN